MANWSEYIRWFVEITTLWVVYFFVLRVLRGTKGLYMLGVAVAVFGGLSVVAKWFELPVLQWILEKAVAILPFFIIVIFQTEIRRLLTMMQMSSLRTLSRSDDRDHELTRLLLGPLGRMSSGHVGALIAIEQTIGLEAWSVTGAILHAPLNDGGRNKDKENPLLETIFYEGGPLHDGGVIIRKREILAAGCTFPLCERDDGNVKYGMRHQAALGLSNECDAVIIVLSEETGNISVAHKGVLTRMANLEKLRQTLNALLRPEKDTAEESSLWGLRKLCRTAFAKCFKILRYVMVGFEKMKRHRGGGEAK